ncbi:MAG: PepSY-associated TM helix domain-containing protein [Nitrospira sp.]|nr:PepSY-associated TM helix domain-containing protein [Nitrospira sp.]
MPGQIEGKASRKFVERALSGHSSLGLATAAFLYLLTVSGIISVFNHELQRWEQPGAPELVPISPQAAERAAISTLAIQQPPTSHFFIQLPTDDLPRVVLTTDTRAVFADGSGTIVAEESHPWTQFVLDLHYYLHLPEKIGLTVVGMLGVMLLGSLISGFLAHPSIFRDAFAFRFSGSARLAQADLHNRLSVWTSPFHISIALTGAILGLASMTAFTIATLDHAGNTEAVFAPVFGEEPEKNDEAAPLAGIARAADPYASRASGYCDQLRDHARTEDKRAASPGPWDTSASSRFRRIL